MDELMIERLSDANDRKWSAMSLGGMYAPTEDNGDDDPWRDWAMDMAIDLSME